ncbi:hypothetical protein [Haloterrigena alkaliphila]|uniref:Uncharacterized protein n=1 Tax=Haloterrigena alkaliphila TaxID=2816475 RepID=A0A8A2VH50_9EURY|nr:hypothetical protein [Haloterrigena alkaliphila]QSX00842.1 hypothetical protein J0X25_07750 [Haloterrigena alkaliphila]
MNRRQYLVRTGAGAVTLTALAGCLDRSEDASSQPVSDRTGERALDRAVGTLNLAAVALAVDEDALEDVERDAFDSGEPTELIDDARDHLETAATELPSDRDADVETLNTYADVLEQLIAVTAVVTDEALADAVDDVVAAIDGEGDREAAAATLDEQTTEIDAARTTYDEALADVRSFGDRFEELTSLEPAQLEEGVAPLGDAVASLATIGDGLESMLDGTGSLERGRDHFENGAYDRARKAFAAAETAFESARTAFDADNPPAGFADRVGTAHCQATRLGEAAGDFRAAASAAADGDRITAREKRNDGEDALEAAGRCA